MTIDEINEKIQEAIREDAEAWNAKYERVYEEREPDFQDCARMLDKLSIR